MGWRTVILAMLAVLAVASEGWRSPFATLGPERGLPASAITTLAQDKDGFLWLGTENGLLRYEGRSYTRWGRDSGLPSDYIQGLLADPQGGLWVSTAQGLVRLAEGRVQEATFDSVPTRGVARFMAFDGTQRLWILASDGLFIQPDPRQAHFVRHPWTPQGRLLVMAAGRATMYFGTDMGVQALSPNGAVQSWGPADGLPATGVSFLAEDGKGCLWAGFGRQLVMKERDAPRFHDESSRLQGGLSPNCLPFRDVDGSLWIPTQAGALHVNGPRTEQIGPAMGLPFRWIRTVFRDREGTLWILGPALARLQGGGRVWNHALAGSASGDVVWSIVRAPKGQLLAATDDGALRVQASGIQRIPGTEGRRIKFLAMDRSGMLWLASTTGPLLWLRSGSQTAEIAPLGEGGYGLNTVMEDSHGSMWLGHPRLGVLRWDPATHRLVQEVGPNTVQRPTVGAYRIREDARGRIWAATSAGLFVRDADKTWHHFDQAQGLLPFGLYGMAFLPDGSAWVHYQEPLGIMRVRVEGGALTVLERRVKGQGLASNLVYAVEVDERGLTWTSTDQGLDCPDLGIHVGRQEGMTSEDCAILALLTEKNQVWVGTAAGLVRYEPDVAQPITPPATAHILYMSHGEVRVDPPFGALKPIPAQDSTVSLRVAVPSYLNEGNLRIQVRLLGLENAWRDLDAPVAHYAALPGGSYRFEARALGPNGMPGPITQLEFKVRPRWWLTWWALTLDGLLGLAVVALIIRIRLSAMARSKAALEALVAHRTEELRVRNEELSSALANVKQLSGLLPICASCKKIRDDMGYWNQLETYISRHSEVGFSHGICPECAEAMYPGHAARRAQKKDPPQG
jgi:ligand-binding sensor domain-containing protein